jgi:uncharacterized protein YwqG
MRARLELPADLEPLRASIEGAIAPSIVLSPADRDESARTRFGGAPLLAPGVEWPRSDRGPLSFLGQLDFRELRGFGGDGLVLPSDGVLTFFYDVEEQPWGYEPSHASGWALRYAPDSASAIDVENPGGAIPFDEEPLVPSAAPSLPWPGDLALRSFGGGEHPEQASWARAYRELVETFAAANAPPLAIGPSRQQVCGHAQWLDGDGRLTAELASSGVSADRGRYRPSDLRRAENGASEWQLLWQLEPHDDRFTWVDLGTLYVLIRRADLAARRFDRAWVVFQAG